MKREERMEAINKIIEKLTRRSWIEAGIKAEITGRPEALLLHLPQAEDARAETFDQIYDLIAVRVLVDTTPDCYAALGIVHTLWTPVPRRASRTISRCPRATCYQSLHNTMIGEPRGHDLLRCRSAPAEMHRAAGIRRRGALAYKDGQAGRLSWTTTLNYCAPADPEHWQNEADDTARVHGRAQG